MGKDTAIEEVFFDKNILASSHINFLFGAGVNGKAFKTLSDFKKTETKIKDEGGNLTTGLEGGINSLGNVVQREAVKETFIAEFNEFNDELFSKNWWEEAAIQNLEKLLTKIHGLIDEAENRTISMKQVNVYTLNYDEIVEKTLARLGYLYNTISASDTKRKMVITDVVGYDYKTRKYMPTFLVSKLHGSIDEPIIPGMRKYEEILDGTYFEVVFKMKEQLCRPNSILIIIGYSGRDKHINKILKDCVNMGLTIYLFEFDGKESKEIQKDVHVAVKHQDDYEHPVDTTKLCCEEIEKVWVLK